MKTGLIHRCVIVLISLIFLAPVALASPPGALPPGEKLLVDAQDTDMIDELVRRGATKLEDYGSFSLWLAPAPDRAGVQFEANSAAAEQMDAIYLRGGQAIDKMGNVETVAESLRQTRSEGEQFWMVQFIGPIKDEWLEEIKALGLTIVMYMPNNAYVVRGNDAALSRLESSVPKSPIIQWTGAYHPTYRLSPTLQEKALLRAAGEWVAVTVQLYNTPNLNGSLDRLRAMGGAVYRSPSKVLDFTNISLQVPAAQLEAIAAWNDVFNVEPYAPPVMHDEVQSQIVAGNVTTAGGNVIPAGPGYLAWLAAKGFPSMPSSYPIVDVVDDGIDTGDASNVLHPDFHEFGLLSNPDRISYINNCTTDTTGNGVGGHGNLNAGIIASYNNRTGWPHVDTLGYRIGLGISPYGRVGGTKVFRNSGGWDDTNCGGTDEGVVAASYNSGAALTSNSWGYSGSAGVYNSTSQAYDALTRDASSGLPGNQQMLHVFSAGNNGPSATTINAPATAKNVIAVGATENVREDGVVDGCGDSAADDADDIADYSSRGNTADGRVKPDIMAPATHIQGPASQDPAYTGAYVCDKYHPAGQTLYTWSSGTSHCVPAISGAVSLLYEYYNRTLRPGQKPSPAMSKALLVNSARYLTGLGANDTLPSPSQGWGDANMSRLFDGVTRQILDQSIVFDQTGQTYQLNGSVGNAGKPFRVSLVWTDPPGSTTGAAYVNDLDLEVTVGGATYKGNVFSGQYSTSGGIADAKNNTESVFLPAGTTGTVLVQVIARNLAGDGVPGNADVTDQDFALVIYNAAPSPLLEPAGQSWQELIGIGNGIIDPGDTGGLTARLKNVGTATATGVSGKVSLTQGPATMLVDTSTYPAIGVNQTRNNDVLYTFAVDNDAVCGSVLDFQHVVTLTGQSPLTYTFEVPIGARLPGPTHTVTSSDPPAPIPDNDPTGVTVTVEITQTGWVNDVEVHLDITHTYVGDLIADLISPQGSSVRLVYRRGGSGDNFTGTIFDDSASTSIRNGTAPFTGRYRPEEPLSELEGESIMGTWILKVVDVGAVDTGSITGFSLDVKAVAAVCDKFLYYYPAISRNATY